MKKNNTTKNFYIISFLYFLPFGIFWPLWQVNLLSRGMDTSYIPLLVAVTSILGCVLEVPTGIVADVVGRKKSCLLSILLLLLGYVFLSTGDSISYFIVAISLISFGNAFYSGALTAWMYSSIKDSSGDEYVNKNKNRIFATLQVFQRIGVIIGAISGGYLAHRNLILPWQVAAFVYCLLFLFVIIQPKEGYTKADNENLFRSIFIEKPKQAYVDFKSSKILILVGIASAAWGLSDSIGQTLFFPYMKSISGKAIWIMGYIQLCLSGSRLLGSLYLYKYFKIKNTSITLALILLLNMVLYIIFAFVSNFYLALAIMTFRVFLLGIYFPMLYAVINEFLPERSRATLNSFYTMITMVAVAIGALLLTQIPIFEYSKILWIICGSILIFPSLIFLSLRKSALK